MIGIAIFRMAIYGFPTVYRVGVFAHTLRRYTTSNAGVLHFAEEQRWEKKYFNQPYSGCFILVYL